MAIAGSHQPYAIRPVTAGAGAGAQAMRAAGIEAAYLVLKGLPGRRRQRRGGLCGRHRQHSRRSRQDDRPRDRCRHTESPNTFWARNLRQFATVGTNLAENARLAAMLWTAYQDAISGCFESKYHYNFWRPTSAIRLASTDGNLATTEDAAWTPVVSTPNHPEYPAAHGCGSGAVTEAPRGYLNRTGYRGGLLA